LYTNGDDRLGQFNPAEASGTEHALVMAIAIRDEQVLLDWEAGGGPVRDTFWSAHLSWSGKRIVVIVPHTGAASSGLWSNLKLTITSASLGAVDLGMSQDQTDAASGLLLLPSPDEDGYFGSQGQLPTTFANLFLKGWPVTCVGAGLIYPSSPQKVVTPTGFVMGQSVDRLRQVYGQRAKYVPPPQPSASAMYDNAGYVVAGTDGDNLVFIPNLANTEIVMIIAGHDIGPNSCSSLAGCR
jgi:hypothetical protein